MNRKKLWWLALPIGIVALCFAFAAFIHYIDEPMYDEEPTKSKRNEFIFYNGGCCFILNDVSVWLSDEIGNNYPLYDHTSPPLWKKQTANFPQNASGSVQVNISFQYGYVTEGHTEFVAMDFENLKSLKENGLLIKFGDGDLRVRSGRQEAFYSYDKTPWADGLSVSKYSDATGKHYEESNNGYKAAFYDKNEIEPEKIKNWLASCEPAEGYYQYIYSDPDSWDMFIYYSPVNGNFSGSNFKFSVDGSVVKVYVTNDGLDNTSTDYILIRIQAPQRGVWPGASELYIDDNIIEMQNNQFTT